MVVGQIILKFPDWTRQVEVYRERYHVGCRAICSEMPPPKTVKETPLPLPLGLVFFLVFFFLLIHLSYWFFHGDDDFCRLLRQCVPCPICEFPKVYYKARLFRRLWDLLCRRKRRSSNRCSDGTAWMKDTGAKSVISAGGGGLRLHGWTMLPSSKKLANSLWMT